MSGPFKMKGMSFGNSPVKQSETFGPHNPDGILKKRFGEGWKDAKAAGWSVVDGKIITPKGKKEGDPLKDA